MRWTNTLERRFDGDVFLWTNNGCPAGVASMTNVYGSYQAALEAEAHSLSRSTFRVTRDGEPFWHPQQAGVVRQSISAAPQVADLPVMRLRPMRRLARRVSVSSTNKDEQQLRLMPQPVYRYESTDPEVEGGAIFAFALGTVPDVLLQIEAIRSDSATLRRYALARFNGNVDLIVRLDEQQVWSAPRLSAKILKRSPPIVFHVSATISRRRGAAMKSWHIDQNEIAAQYRAGDLRFRQNVSILSLVLIEASTK